METQRELVEQKAIIQKKFLDLKRQRQNNRDHLDEFFEPVVEPLRELTRAEKPQTVVNQKGKLLQEYMKLFKSPNRLDKTYGLKYNPLDDSFTIGNKTVDIDQKDNIIIGDNQFEGTRGLYELLLKKEPSLSLISKADRNNYSKILEISAAHKRGYKDNGKLSANSGFKYKNIISPLFSGESYQYYSNPNQLVERLMLLHASSLAGNSSHHNEIIDILNQLKRQKYIE